jgi:hypothetical protein
MSANPERQQAKHTHTQTVTWRAAASKSVGELAGDRGCQHGAADPWNELCSGAHAFHICVAWLRAEAMRLLCDHVDLGYVPRHSLSESIRIPHSPGTWVVRRIMSVASDGSQRSSCVKQLHPIEGNV